MPSQSGASKLETHSAKMPSPLLPETRSSHQPLVEQAKEEPSSSRAFLEMTESLKKMLDSVVSGLAGNKEEGQWKERRGIRRYERASSGSANDAADRGSSASEASFSRTLRRNTNRSVGRRVRFKAGAKRSSATQTDGQSKHDAETQVTPEKRATNQGPPAGDTLLLRPSTLSLARWPLRPRPRPSALPIHADPTSTLLAFGKSSRSIHGRALFGQGPVNLSPEPEGRGSTSLCGSLSSSCSSVLPTDGWEYPVNNTLVSRVDFASF